MGVTTTGVASTSETECKGVCEGLFEQAETAATKKQAAHSWCRCMCFTAAVC
jgi:hypothetical protein